MLLLLLGGTYHDKRDLNDDQELAAALGNMIVAWSAAETALQLVFRLVTNLPWEIVEVNYFKKKPTLQARTEFLKDVLNKWETSDYDVAEIISQIEKLYRLAGTRHHWVHGKFAGLNRANETVVFDMREDRNSPDRIKPIEPAHVRVHIKAVHNRIDEIKALIEQPEQ